MTRRRFSRRGFLRAAGGAALTLPILQSFGVRAAGETFPKRFITFFNANGTVEDAWWPLNASSETEWELNEILQPLASYKSRMLQLEGIDMSVTSEGPGGPHQRGMGALLTGAELQEGDMVGGDGSRAGWANGQSVDQKMAEVIGINTAVGSLELGVRAIEADVRGRINYAGPAKALPPINDPLETYLRLFEGFNGDPDELATVRARRKSVLDAVAKQFTALEARLPAEDKQKLQAHLELVRDVERRLDNGAGGGVTCSKPPQPPVLGVEDEADMAEIAKLQADLLAMAVACDMTRVATLQISTSFNYIPYPFLNSTKLGHTLSHAGPSDTVSQDELKRRLVWHAEQLAYLCDRLDSIPEGDGTALDNTVILWGDEVAVGNTHRLTNMPFLLIGGGGGVLRTGRHLKYDSVPHNRLLMALLAVMGIDVDSFGNPDYCDGGPLTDLT